LVTLARVKYFGKLERERTEEIFSIVLRGCADIRSYDLFYLVDLLISSQECDEPILLRRFCCDVKRLRFAQLSI